MSGDGKKIELKVIDEDFPIALDGAVDPDRQASKEEIRLNVPMRKRSRIDIHKRQPGVEIFLEQQQLMQKQVEDEWQSQRTPHRLPWGWFALIGAILGGALLWSALRVESARPAMEQLREETIEHLARDEAEVAEATRLIEDIERTVRAYFAISSPEILGSVIRHPKRVQPLIAEYYRQHTREARQVKDIVNLEPITLGHHGNFWWATVTMENGSMEMLVIEIADKGEAKIDWESHVCHQPMPWDEFALSRPIGKAMDFRVIVEPVGKFAGGPENAGDWSYFRITTRNAEEFLLGHTVADSAVAAELENLFQEGKGAKASLILRLVFPDAESPPREVVIEKVVNERWIYLDDPEVP